MANNNKRIVKQINKLNILDLPTDLLMDIFELFPYEIVSKIRQVCRAFNDIGGKVLNAGFNKIIRRHSAAAKLIKTQLPRRESERRNHILARHSDVLSSIETRISMLSLTYSKYIDLKLCCFIPGRVLDEINRVLDMIGDAKRTMRPHEVLQELRDISSMAIEHFDEFIVINFKKAYTDNLKLADYSNLNIDHNSIALRNELCNISQDTERFQDMESATKELYERLIFGPSPKHKINNINSNNGNANGNKKIIPTFEDSVKKIEKNQREMQETLNKLLCADKRNTRQLSNINILTRDCAHKITLMQKRIKELETKNRELHATLIRITETDDNVESSKSNKPKTSNATTARTSTTSSIINLENSSSLHTILKKPSCSVPTLKDVLDEKISSGSELPSLFGNLTNETIETASSSSDGLPLKVFCGRKRANVNDMAEFENLKKQKQ